MPIPRYRNPLNRRAHAARALCLALFLALGACNDSTPDGAAKPTGPAAAVAGAKGLVILNPQDPERDYNFNFGRLPLGETGVYVVELSNEEGRAVAVDKVTPSCSCTSATLAFVEGTAPPVQASSYWGEKPFVVPAGAKLLLTLRVDSRHVPQKNSAKLLRIVIQSDSSVDPYKVIEAHVVVDMPFYVVPSIMNLGQVPIGGIAQGSVEITPAMGGGELVTGVLTHPENMQVALEGPDVLGFTKWRVSVRWFPPLERGSQLRSVVLSTSGPGGIGEGPPLDVQIQAIGVDDVIVEPIAFDVPAKLELNAGAGAVRLRSLVGGQRLGVVNLRTEGPHAEAFVARATAFEPDSNGRSEQWVVQLTCIAPFEAPGAFAGSVWVTLENANTPLLRIPYVRKDALQRN